MQKPETKIQINDVKKTEHVRYLNEIDEFGDARARTEQFVHANRLDKTNNAPKRYAYKQIRTSISTRWETIGSSEKNKYHAHRLLTKYTTSDSDRMFDFNHFALSVLWTCKVVGEWTSNSGQLSLCLKFLFVFSSAALKAPNTAHELHSLKAREREEEENRYFHSNYGHNSAKHRICHPKWNHRITQPSQWYRDAKQRGLRHKFVGLSKCE